MSKFDCRKLLVLSAPVAAILLFEGFTAEPSVNPHNPKKTAWLFDNATEVASAAAEAYRQLGRDVPPFLANIMERIEAEQNAAAEGGDSC